MLGLPAVRREDQDLFKDKQVDVNNHKDSYLVIQEFVKENLEGIKLKDGEIHSCPTCNCEDDTKLIDKDEETNKAS